jgi:hypothetical protein
VRADPAHWLADVAEAGLPKLPGAPRARATRHPLHVRLLWPLVPFTLLALAMSIGEGEGPYFHMTTFSWERVIPRPATYSRLPPYEAVYGFTPFNWWEKRWRDVSVEVRDTPEWPNGSRGFGPDGPLPPNVRRRYLVGVSPWIPLTLPGSLWALWLIPFTRYHRNQARRGGRGFEVEPPPRGTSHPA